MRYGISNLSIVPVRSEPHERSEMCTQILFGECYIIIDEIDKWCRVQMALDEYQGWIDRKMVYEIDVNCYNQLSADACKVTTDVFNIVQRVDDYSSFLIVAGSSLPFFNESTRSFRLGDNDYHIQGNHFANHTLSARDLIIENGLKYFNAPYLWGGRSPLGIDCSGFSQILYKMAGIIIPRDAVQQSVLGANLSFVEEASPGDLAFFDNEEGEIVHVGIIWENHKIIHASGKVRIDNVDHFGIYNVDTKRYTHKMRLMRRLISESV